MGVRPGPVPAAGHHHGRRAGLDGAARAAGRVPGPAQDRAAAPGRPASARSGSPPPRWATCSGLPCSRPATAAAAGSGCRSRPVEAAGTVGGHRGPGRVRPHRLPRPVRPRGAGNHRRVRCQWRTAAAHPGSRRRQVASPLRWSGRAPRSSTSWYTATSPGGRGPAHAVIFRSTDGGRTWQRRADPCGGAGAGRARHHRAWLPRPAGSPRCCARRAAAPVATFVRTSADNGSSSRARRTYGPRRDQGPAEPHRRGQRGAPGAGHRRRVPASGPAGYAAAGRPPTAACTGPPWSAARRRPGAPRTPGSAAGSAPHGPSGPPEDAGQHCTRAGFLDHGRYPAHGARQGSSNA